MEAASAATGHACGATAHSSSATGIGKVKICPMYPAGREQRSAIVHDAHVDTESKSDCARQTSRTDCSWFVLALGYLTASVMGLRMLATSVVGVTRFAGGEDCAGSARANPTNAQRMENAIAT